MPLVNWMLIGWRHVDAGGGLAQQGPIVRRDGREIEPAGAGSAAELRDDPELREPRGVQVARRAGRYLGRKRLDHGDVVARLEGLRRDQRLHADFRQRVLEFRQLVRRIDVDLDQAHAGGRELRQCPLDAVGSPDADPVAGFEAKCQEAGREFVDAPAQLRKAPPDALFDRHQRFRVRPARRGAVEHFADGVFDQRRRGVTDYVAARRMHVRWPGCSHEATPGGSRATRFLSVPIASIVISI